MKTIQRLVWNEMIHAAYWEQYLSQYIGSRYNAKNSYNRVILILSTIGASSYAGWKVIPDEKIISLIIFLIMIINQLFAIFKKEMVVSEDMADKMRSLRLQYIEYFNKLEKLYVNIIDGDIKDKDAKNVYFQLRDSICPAEKLKDSLNIKRLKTPSQNGLDQVLSHLTRVYGSQYPLRQIGVIENGISKTIV